MESKTAQHIRRVALRSGWEVCAVLGQPHTHSGGTWDHDIFHIGSVTRKLDDGTPVIECEHSIQVWYDRSGAVRFATGHQFTVPKVLYHRGINSGRGERNKAERILAALRAKTSVIPKRSEL